MPRAGRARHARPRATCAAPSLLDAAPRGAWRAGARRWSREAAAARRSTCSSPQAEGTHPGGARGRAAGRGRGRRCPSAAGRDRPRAPARRIARRRGPSCATVRSSFRRAARLSTGAPLRLERTGRSSSTSADGSCRSCSADLQALKRGAPRDARIVLWPRGPEQRPGRCARCCGALPLRLAVRSSAAARRPALGATAPSLVVIGRARAGAAASLHAVRRGAAECSSAARAPRRRGGAAARRAGTAGPSDRRRGRAAAGAAATKGWRPARTSPRRRSSTRPRRRLPRGPASARRCACSRRREARRRLAAAARGAAQPRRSAWPGLGRSDEARARPAAADRRQPLPGRRRPRARSAGRGAVAAIRGGASVE